MRPLRELTGAELFNEVFLTDVFVPDDRLVGAPTGGWAAARTTLANERVSMGRGSSMGPGVEALLALVDAGPHPPGTTPDPRVLDTVGGLVARTQALAAMGVRTTLRALGGGAPGPESSIRKLLGVELDQEVQEVGLELLGPAAVPADGRRGVVGRRVPRQPQPVDRRRDERDPAQRDRRAAAGLAARPLTTTRMGPA